jgi:hypothetical protein
MKESVWKIVFAALTFIDIALVGFPIAEVYFGTVYGQRDGLQFIMHYGWISSVINIVVFGLFLGLKRPKTVGILIASFAILASIYYLFTIHMSVQ